MLKDSEPGFELRCKAGNDIVLNKKLAAESLWVDFASFKICEYYKCCRNRIRRELKWLAQ